MTPTMPIEWPDNATDAIALQQILRHQVRIERDHGDLDIIAGIDCSFPREDISRAVVTLIDARTLQPLQSVIADAPTRFPYVSGLLSFREIPVILDALAKLDRAPDLLMVDGAGIAHPRRLGIAAHLGVILNLPSLGVAKSRLCGRHENLGARRGDFVSLMDKGERIGTVLRSKEKCLPLYISPGHRVDQDEVVEIVLRCLTKYRLPEPTRIADKISKQKDEDFSPSLL